MKSITELKTLICSTAWLLLLLATPAQAQAPVWMVEKDGRHLFIGGTMHILTEKDYPLPDAFEMAYRQSTRIVFETDIEKMQNPAFRQYLLGELSYSDGRTLRQVLRSDTYAALTTFFAQRGMPMASIDQFKPGMVVTLMTIIELQRLGVVGVGVDSYFDQKASSDHKAKGQLETVEEHLAFITNMGAGQEDAMLSYNIADVERLPELWESMTAAWRAGDLPGLEEMFAQPMRADFPAVNQTLLIDRNNAWIPQLEALAGSPEVEFVLVGALHLSGADGLLAQLAARGYQITQLP